MIGLAIGLLILKFYKQPLQVIYEYPHPQNIKENIYKDPNGTCYTYSVKEVNCDANEGNLRFYPIQ